MAQHSLVRCHAQRWFEVVSRFVEAVVRLQKYCAAAAVMASAGGYALEAFLVVR